MQETIYDQFVSQYIDIIPMSSSGQEDEAELTGLKNCNKMRLNMQGFITGNYFKLWAFDR